MQRNLLEKVIRSYLETDQSLHVFSWQGGEPTLMGLDFFKTVVSYQQTYRKTNKQIVNNLQTNGTAIDKKWADFLAHHQFLVGVSLDGPRHIHNQYRTYTNGKGSYASVISGIGHLQRKGVDFNILTLVSQANVRHALDVYRFLRDDLGCCYHQYIECVEFDESGRLKPFAIDGHQWGDFLCTIFDEWIKNDINRVSVRLFDAIISMLTDGMSTMCTLSQDCRHYLVVEHNGDIYPCDFFVNNATRLGNIKSTSWEMMLASPVFKAFGARKRHWHNACDSCPYISYCAGDCPKNRSDSGKVPGFKSALCEGWQQFYAHALPAFRQIALELAYHQDPFSYASESFKRAGRNDPCPCGSGKKYKKCCLNRLK